MLAGRSNRSGFSVEAGPSRPTLLWDGSTSAVYISGAVIEGNTVISSRSEFGDPPTDTWIVAQNLTTGAVRWRAQLSAFFPDAWGSQVIGVLNGRVFATRASNGANSEYLWALDESTGAVLWRSELLIDGGGSENGLAFTAEGDLIHGNFLSITRIDSKTGLTVWRMPRFCTGGGGCEAALAGSRVYGWDFVPFGGTTVPVVSVWDVGTGVRQYTSPPGACKFGSQNAPFVAGDSVLAVCQSATGASTLVSFLDTGAELFEKWRVPLPYLAFASFGVGAEGSIYSYSPDQQVVRLDPATGRTLNASSALDVFGVFTPRLVVGSSGLVFVTSGSTLYALNRDLSTRWSAAITTPAAPSMGGNGTLVVPGGGTTMRAYDSRLSYYTVPGCRLVDTRVSSSGEPALAANSMRSFGIAGSCGVSASAQTVAINVVATQSTMEGFLTAFRANTAVPPTSSLNYKAGKTRAVMILAPVGALGEIAIRCTQAGGTVDLIVDVLGYFE